MALLFSFFLIYFHQCNLNLILRKYSQVLVSLYASMIRVLFKFYCNFVYLYKRGKLRFTVISYACNCPMSTSLHLIAFLHFKGHNVIVSSLRRDGLAMNRPHRNTVEVMRIVDFIIE